MVSVGLELVWKIRSSRVTVKYNVNHAFLHATWILFDILFLSDYHSRLWNLLRITWLSYWVYTDPKPRNIDSLQVSTRPTEVLEQNLKRLHRYRWRVELFMKWYVPPYLVVIHTYSCDHKWHNWSCYANCYGCLGSSESFT